MNPYYDDEWHPWFAWFPVRVEEARGSSGVWKWGWLKYIERAYRYGTTDGGFWIYREKRLSDD